LPVVADSSVLIIFHQCNLAWLLPEIFADLVAPPVVAREVFPSVGGLPHWVRVQAPTAIHEMAQPLDIGEREAISVAMEIAADTILLDDLPARKVAKRLGLHVVGSAGALLLAKDNGSIPAVAAHLDTMRANGLYVSNDLYDHVLRTAGEA
jgi:predicted nucleic acid-binding protein